MACVLRCRSISQGRYRGMVTAVKAWFTVRCRVLGFLTLKATSGRKLHENQLSVCSDVSRRCGARCGGCHGFEGAGKATGVMWSSTSAKCQMLTLLQKLPPSRHQMTWHPLADVTSFVPRNP